MSEKYNIDTKTIRKYFKSINTKSTSTTNADKDVVVIMDCTYFRRTFCVMVFRDAISKENLYWKFLPYETIWEYKLGIMHIQDLGFNILAIVCDGRRGIFQAFPDIPVQMCQFHQVAIVTRYLTRNPKLQASIELTAIVRKLKRTDELSFNGMLAKWGKKWSEFMRERTINLETGKWNYTHKRLRSAYYSLVHNLEYLFTYQKYPNIDIPNTTNGLEGIFTDVKTKVRVHKGIQIENKQKLINEVLKTQK